MGTSQFPSRGNGLKDGPLGEQDIWQRTGATSNQQNWGTIYREAAGLETAQTAARGSVGRGWAGYRCGGDRHGHAVSNHGTRGRHQDRYHEDR